MTKINIKVGANNHEFDTFADAIDWLLLQPKVNCTVTMDHMIYEGDTQNSVSYLRMMEKEADSFAKLGKAKAEKKATLVEVEKKEGINRAEQAQSIIDDMIQLLAAYTKKSDEMKAILEGDGSTREQLPQTQKGKIDLRYSFDDDSKILVTFRLNGQNIAGVIGSKVEPERKQS